MLRKQKDQNGMALLYKPVKLHFPIWLLRKQIIHFTRLRKQLESLTRRQQRKHIPESQKRMKICSELVDFHACAQVFVEHS
jgi:hypothetical protein